MAENDSSLIQAALAGDRHGLEKLVRKYQAPVFALVLERVRDGSAAEEITQDALIHASQRLSQLKDPGRFPAWLRSIALNQCRMWLRSRRRETARKAALRDGMGGSPSTEGPSRHSREESFDIAGMIADLPKGLRAAAVLCFKEDLAPAEAAAVLGLKPATLRKRLHDARVALQRKVVGKAESELRLGLLPRDFAQRCVCRCAQARKARGRKEGTAMVKKKKSCGCGCTDGSKRKAKPAKSKK